MTFFAQLKLPFKNPFPAISQHRRSALDSSKQNQSAEPEVDPPPISKMNPQDESEILFGAFGEPVPGKSTSQHDSKRPPSASNFFKGRLEHQSLALAQAAKPTAGSVFEEALAREFSDVEQYYKQLDAELIKGDRIIKKEILFDALEEPFSEELVAKPVSALPTRPEVALAPQDSMSDITLIQPLPPLPHYAAYRSLLPTNVCQAKQRPPPLKRTWNNEVLGLVAVQGDAISEYAFLRSSALPRRAFDTGISMDSFESVDLTDMVDSPSPLELRSSSWPRFTPEDIAPDELNSF